MANKITVRDADYHLVRTQTVTGCGARFDGRVKFTLQRVSDGQMFAWLGSRTSKRVPANAKLSPL